MPFTFAAGNIPSQAGAALGASWRSLVYVQPDGKVIQGTDLDPTTVPIGTVAYTQDEYTSPEPPASGGSPGDDQTAADLAAIRKEYERMFGEPPPSDLKTSAIRQIIRDAQVSGGVGAAPVETAQGTTIPNGATLVIVKNPKGSDADRLYYLTYEWRGVQLAYEIGDADRYRELFGDYVEDTFSRYEVISQATFDDVAYVEAGAADELYGSEESLASVLEREVRALGLEDLPSWLSESPEALAIVATGTAEEWSSGRLWTELSRTQAFEGRFGDAIGLYLAEGLTVGDAVDQLVADENSLRTALRPWLSSAADAPIELLHQYLNAGWTAGAVGRVLEVAEGFLRDPAALDLANVVLARSELGELDEVSFINALAGYGPQETIEALNTATAARALDEAGIDLDDADIGVIMEVVDTSDRLLTAESWSGLAQQLSLNLIRFNTELDQEKLGVHREDIVAAAFGKESPSGASAGETLSLLARFERDRRAAAAGYEETTAFLDDEGQLRVQGRRGL